MHIMCPLQIEYGRLVNVKPYLNLIEKILHSVDQNYFHRMQSPFFLIWSVILFFIFIFLRWISREMACMRYAWAVNVL